MKQRVTIPGRSRWGSVSALASLALLAACGGIDKYPETWSEPRSDWAREIWGLQQLTTVLGVGVGIAVFAVTAYIVLRFRHNPDHPEPEQVHGNTTLELAWTLIPAVLLAIIAVPTVRAIFASHREPPPNALVVEAIGWQWWWEFRYPVGNDTVVTANEIHVAVGTPVQVRIRGGDVVHNFWVPAMGGKRYAIPNRVNAIMFTPEEPGVYMGRCTEFCGDSHALMRMRLVAHTPDGFRRWFANEATPSSQLAEPVLAAADSAVLVGKQLFSQKGCVGCHAIRGHEGAVGRLGPNLTHVANRRTIAAGVLENNATNLRLWINNPQAVKPGAKMQNLGWTDQEVQYIVAYLQTLQ